MTAPSEISSPSVSGDVEPIAPATSVKPRRSAVLRAILIAAGTVFVVLGVIGIFLPILPTTPFLLLAAVCYSRSSERCHHWLLTNRWCGEYIRNYRDGLGIRLRHKLLSLAILWGAIGYSIAVVQRDGVRLLLLVIAIAVTVHIVLIKTRRTDVRPSEKKENI